MKRPHGGKARKGQYEVTNTIFSVKLLTFDRRGKFIIEGEGPMSLMKLAKDRPRNWKKLTNIILEMIEGKDFALRENTEKKKTRL